MFISRLGVLIKDAVRRLCKVFLELEEPRLVSPFVKCGSDVMILESDYEEFERQTASHFDLYANELHPIYSGRIRTYPGGAKRNKRAS